MAVVGEYQRTRLSVSKPLWVRLRYFLALWALKAAMHLYLIYASRKLFQPNNPNKPTYTKQYPSRPELLAHVYIPASYKPGSKPLPLLVDVHGGGFAIGHPLLDAADNAAFAHQHGFVVVSLTYRLAPWHPWPVPVHDVAALITDVLSDEELPVDKQRAVAIGYSAGGNLVLTSLQMRGLYEKFKAVVAIYPVTDFAIDPAERWAARTPHPSGREDSLAKTWWQFTWGYVPPATRMANPLLSPRYAERRKLPRSVYVLGCEYDMLCSDARNLAEDMADQEAEDSGAERRDLADHGNPGWDCGRVRWRMVRSVEHGFNLIAHRKTGEEHALYQRKTEEMRNDIVEWIRTVAFQ